MFNIHIKLSVITQSNEESVCAWKITMWRQYLWTYLKVHNMYLVKQHTRAKDTWCNIYLVSKLFNVAIPTFASNKYPVTLNNSLSDTKSLAVLECFGVCKHAPIKMKETHQVHLQKWQYKCNIECKHIPVTRSFRKQWKISCAKLAGCKPTQCVIITQAQAIGQTMFNTSCPFLGSKICWKAWTTKVDMSPLWPLYLKHP